MRRAFLVLFVLAAAAGVAGGLLYTWVLEPVEAYESAPDALRDRDKLIYLTLIGDLYAYEDDLEQAQARLVMVGVESDGSTLARHIEAYLDGAGRPEDVRNLARLAQDLGAHGGVLAVFASDPTPSPVPSLATSAGPTVSPILTPSPTPAPSFQLTERTALCAGPGEPGKITVWVQDMQGTPLPGMEVLVSWADGQDRFFTGLRPERGAGYGDFEMAAGIEYDASLVGYRSDVAQELTARLSPGYCQEGVVAVDWRLVFQRAQPAP
ncbi:MAG: hypothetical protein M8467_15970 [Anaerolineae bacterium]|nr:hypothetical protein [Anaerolineae bacterium]